jgi:hypothetical protein
VPKIQIKRITTWMGTIYRIYIDGMYVGAVSTQKTAREGAEGMLHVLERIKQKKSRAAPL